MAHNHQSSSDRVSLSSQIDCTIRALPVTTCSPLNQTCLCADTKFNEAVAPCIISHCTVKEALGMLVEIRIDPSTDFNDSRTDGGTLAVGIALANASVLACGHPRTDQRPVIHWVSSIATVISTMFVGLRLASRAAKLGTWGHDDTAVMLAFVSGFHVLYAQRLQAYQAQQRPLIWASTSSSTYVSPP